MSKCSNCPYSSFGSRDPFSDLCDGCTHDPNTGWEGYTDHSIDPDQENEEEE